MNDVERRAANRALFTTVLATTVSVPRFEAM